MSEDADKSSKTEDPTEKRKENALEKGSVLRSQEVNHLLNIIAGLVIFILLIGRSARILKETLSTYIAKADSISISIYSVQYIISDISKSLLSALWPVFIVLITFSFIAARLQHPFIFVFSKIKPNFSQFLNKLNIINGLKNRFKLITLIELLKNIAKMIILVAVTAMVVWPLTNDMYQIITIDLYQFSAYLQKLVVYIYAATIPFLIFLALIDFFYQKKEHLQKLRMTKQEVKDEYKQSEGNPEVKAKIRKLRNQRSRQRMMQSVPKADVVITNPTHFACALEYNMAMMSAPKLVAKGVDSLALKIRKVAEEHDIPIVTNPVLARTLYNSVEIDGEIQTEHYEAVAKIISFIMRTRGHLKSSKRNNNL